MAHPHAARLTARGAGEVAAAGFRGGGGSAAAEGARRVGGASGSAGASGAVEGARRVCRASGRLRLLRRRGSGVARFSGRWRKSGGSAVVSGQLRLQRRRGSGERRERGGSPRVGGDTDWWWLGSRGLCGGGGSRVDGASGRLFPGGVWRRSFDVIETAQASYAQGGGNRLLRECQP